MASSDYITRIYNDVMGVNLKFLKENVITEKTPALFLLDAIYTLQIPTILQTSRTSALPCVNHAYAIITSVFTFKGNKKQK